MTQAFASNGARVYIVGRRLEVLEKTAKTHSEDLPSGGAILPIQGDVSSKESITAILEQIKAKEKYIDVLVNNSGIPGPFWAPEGKTTADEIGESLFATDYAESMSVLQTNMLGYFYVSGAFISLLSKSPNNPQIINITSVAAFGRNIPPGIIYSMTKAADTHLTKMLSTHLRNTNVRVNAIAPGLFPSELTTGKENTAGDNESEWDDEKGTIGLPVSKAAGNGVGHDADIASSVLYLANKRARYTSGAVLLVDGGVLNEGPSSY